MTVFRSSLDAARHLSESEKLRRQVAALFSPGCFLGDLARETGALDDHAELCLVCALEGYRAGGGVIADLDDAISPRIAWGRIRSRGTARLNAALRHLDPAHRRMIVFSRNQHRRRRETGEAPVSRTWHTHSAPRVIGPYRLTVRFLPMLTGRDEPWWWFVVERIELPHAKQPSLSGTRPTEKKAKGFV